MLSSKNLALKSVFVFRVVTSNSTKFCAESRTRIWLPSHQPCTSPWNFIFSKTPVSKSQRKNADPSSALLGTLQPYRNPGEDRQVLPVPGNWDNSPNLRTELSRRSITQ